MSLCSQDQTAEIHFNNDHKVGTAYEMITSEKTQIVKTYDKPPVKKSISGQQYFRSEIKESQRQLTPILNHRNCLSFDQSYFTRTIGQIEIQKKISTSGIDLFSGAGFGSLQAFWGALGWNPNDLQKFFCIKLRDAIKKGIVRKMYEITTSVLIDSKYERLATKYIEAELKKVFSVKKRPLTLRDCTKDVFIPIQDISGRTMIITKQNYPNMPIYVAVGASLFDPVFFETKKHFNHMGVLNGDVVKNNDFLINKNNPNMNMVSVGCPVRIFDKGFDRISRSDLALKISDQKHETDLIMSSMIDAKYKRYQCHPIDEVYQFAYHDNAIELAMGSADKVEL